MSKSPNGTSSSKTVSYGWFVKDHMHLSEPFSNFFFPSPCFVPLWICVPSAQSCSKTLWCLWIRSHVFHLPSTSRCQRQAVPLPQRRRGFRHPSKGKIGFWVAVTAHRPRLFCSQCSASTGQGLRAEQRFELSAPKHSRRTHLSKTSVLGQQNEVFQEFQIGHLNGSQKHFNQINQSRATCKNWDSHFSIF